MTGMLHFTTLVIATMFAGAAAVACNWLLLGAAFQLMRPATARRTIEGAIAKRSVRTELVRGMARVARAFSAHR